MKNRNLTLLLIHSAAFLLTACGMKDTKPSSQGGTTVSLSCASRPLLLRKSETYNLAWTSPTAGPYSVAVNPGDFEGIDWGSASVTADGAATYTAPAYVPDMRTLTLDVSQSGQSSAIGSCPLYVLPDNVYGVKDDGNAVGLIASVYAVPSTTPATPFPAVSGTPDETSVIRAFEMVNLPIFTGITASTQYFAIRFTGSIQIPASNDYGFRLTASNLGNFYIDGMKLVSSTGAAATSLAAGIPLSAGKHTVLMEYLDIGTGNATLKLEWQQRQTSTTFGAFTTIPYSAFDRQ